MASKMGWIKLHREIQEHWVYSDPKLLKIWIDILLTANHKPATISVKGKIISIEPGQFWTSIRALSGRWGVDTKTVKKYLTLLQSDGMIFADFQPGYGTLLTVHNYCIYQDFSEASSHRDSHRDSHRQGTEIPTEIPYKQEVKNNKEQHKNEKNIGPAPGDPDYFEEV